MGTAVLQLRNAVDHVDRQVEAIYLVANRELQRSIDVALFLIPAYMYIGVIRPTVGELMNKPGISVEVEHDRLVSCKERVKVLIGESVRMLSIRLKTVQVHHVHKADLQLRDLLS